MSSNDGQGMISKWSLEKESIVPIPIPIPFNIARFSDDFKFLFTATDTVITILSFPELIQIKSFTNSRAFPVFIHGSKDYNQILNLYISPDNKYLIANNCSSQSNIYNLEIDNVLSIDSESINNYSDILLYPNPATDFIEINIINETNPNASFAQIFNIFGIEVSKSSLTDGNNRINISHFPAGVYYIRIGDKTEKFVKF
jgi:hypothetical protein